MGGGGKWKLTLNFNKIKIEKEGNIPNNITKI
jgi:hypothetical protein